MHIPDVPIRDEEIRLGQFIKLANLVETGGVAKEIIAAGGVFVNGAQDTRRGKVLRPGDEVTIVDSATGDVQAGARVAAPHRADPDDLDEDLGDYFDEATADDDFDPEKWRNM